MNNLLVEAKEANKPEAVALDHPDRIKIQKMCDFITDNGGDHSKLKIHWISVDNRCITANQDIPKGTRIVFVPKDCLMTIDMII